MLSSPGLTLAATCGQAQEGGGAPVVGEIALDTGNSADLAQSFSGDTKKKQVRFIYKVSGCTLAPDTEIKVNPGGDEADAVSFEAPTAKGELLVLDGTIDPKKFDPGTHKPTVIVSSSAGVIKSQTLQLTLERKQPPLWPLVLSVIAFLAGLYYAFKIAEQAAIDAYDKKAAEQAGTTPPKPGIVARLKRGKNHRKKVNYGTRAQWLGVFVGAVGGAAAAFGTGYLKSATWALEFPNWAILMAAVALATAGGAAAGLLKAVTAREPPKPRS